MAYQITIEPSGHAYSADPEENILQSALDAGFVLPYGCRNGACGSCKGKVIAGTIEQRAYQHGALTNEEREAGFALFCCALPLSDLTIECRELGAVRDIPIKTLPCRVQKMERPAPDVMILYLRLPTNERLQFLAGQYIDILLKDGRRRSFSFANAPHDDEFLQLHIRLVPGGHFTEHVFTQMRERDILRFQGPHGGFLLREESTKPILFVAGGTGFAPIKAMIEHAFHIRISRPMSLYWGARSDGDLYMRALPKSWERLDTEFRFVPVVSEPDRAHNWRGRTGLVHEAVMGDHADLSPYQVYVCGSPEMVDAARRDFTTLRGLPSNEFYSDAFSYASD